MPVYPYHRRRNLSVQPGRQLPGFFWSIVFCPVVKNETRSRENLFFLVPVL